MKDIIHHRPKWNGTDQVEFIMIRTTGGTEDLNATGMMVPKQLADDLADALEWYIRNDDANEGDVYYMDGQNKGIEALTKYRNATR